MKRFRFTRRGWYLHHCTMLGGMLDARTGQTIPPPDGILKREIWFGPAPTADELVTWGVL